MKGYLSVARIMEKPSKLVIYTCAAVFIAVMIIFRRVIEPAILDQWGNLGFIVTMGVIFAVGVFMERRQ